MTVFQLTAKPTATVEETVVDHGAPNRATHESGGRQRALRAANSTRMKIVVIAHAYPPFPASGAARAAKLVATFRDAGHEVHVITARVPGEASEPRIREEGLTVHPISVIPHPRQLYVMAKRLFRRGRRIEDPADHSGVDDPFVTGRSAWKRHVLSLLLLPDDLQGFVAPAVVHALRTCGRNIDLVYTTSPPASGHLAGLLLKLLSGARWAADFRDPWCPHRGQLTSWEREKVELWLERLCLRKADHVVSVSEGIDTVLRAQLPRADQRKFVIARNGIDQLSPAACPASIPAGDRILYLGNLYWKRDPRLFLSGLAAAIQRLQLRKGDVLVEFAGACRDFGGESVVRMVEELGLTDFVEFRDWVPHAEALQLLDEATMFLLFAQEQPDQVPNKLYEYLGTRKPIIAVSDKMGETTRMLRQVGGNYVATEEDGVEEMADLLEQALTRRQSQSSRRNDELLEEWRTEVQMKRLLDAVTAPPRSR